MLALATTLTAQPASPLEGGIPLVADGKIIGALGVSGAMLTRAPRIFPCRWANPRIARRAGLFLHGRGRVSLAHVVRPRRGGRQGL